MCMGGLRISQEETRDREEEQQQHPSIQESLWPSFQDPFPVSEWLGCPLTSTETLPILEAPPASACAMEGDTQHNPLLSGSSQPGKVNQAGFSHSFSPFPPGLLFLVLQQPNHEVSVSLGNSDSVVLG